MPVTSIFSFSHNDPENNEFVLYGKQHNVGKGENAGNIFSFLYAHWRRDVLCYHRGGRAASPILCPEHISKTMLDLIKGECSAQEP